MKAWLIKNKKEIIMTTITIMTITIIIIIVVLLLIMITETYIVPTQVAQRL